MTDDELKQLVASLAIDQKALTKQMAETDKELRAMFKESEAQFNRMKEELREIGKDREARSKQMDDKLERMGIHLGNVTRNQGDVAEEFFFHSLVNDTRLGGIHFDDVTKNMSKHRGQIQEEYDLVLTNGDAIAIIEVKYKVHQKDLDKLERKMRNFKALFPIYQAFKQYGAIASFHIHEDAKKEALERGYFVLQRRGELIHAENGEHLTVL